MLIARRGNHAEKTVPLWMTYGEDPWLVSVDSSLVEMPPLAVVVRAGDVWAAMMAEDGRWKTAPGEPHLLTDRSAEGDVLGPSFPDLKVAFSAQEEIAQKPWSLQYTFYLVALLLVLSITLFGAYLLWRDVRRELNLATMRSQFVANVSHELKTPLTAIRMFAETLRLGRFPDPQVQTEYLDTIVNGSERLTRLLNNVLDFSKIEQGNKRYHPTPTSLAEVVHAAAVDSKQRQIAKVLASFFHRCRDTVSERAHFGFYAFGPLVWQSKIPYRNLGCHARRACLSQHLEHPAHGWLAGCGLRHDGSHHDLSGPCSGRIR